MIKLLSSAVVLVFLCSFNVQGETTDVINIKFRSSSLDLRDQYIENLMVRALRISKEKYGPFKINRLKIKIPRHLVLQALIDADRINVSIAMTSNEWEEAVIPIRIPVRRGIFKYRLLLVHKDDLKRYEGITTVKQLKELSVGLNRGWTTLTILKALDFKIVEAQTYDRVFEMLHNKRFDFTVRGIHEAEDEIRLRKRYFDDLVIEPNIMLHIPAPSYFFVSPKYPRIAERLEYGLEKMLASGELKRLFEHHFLQYINDQDLENRRIIEVGNPLLPENTPLDRSELWFDFNMTDN